MGEKPENLFQGWTIRQLLGTAGGVFALWAVLILAAGRSPDPYTLGTFGDAFGPITGLATAMALVFAFWSVRLQHEELVETRKEMTLQRAELAKQNELAEARLDLMAAEIATQFNHSAHQLRANHFALFKYESTEFAGIIKAEDVRALLEEDTDRHNTVEKRIDSLLERYLPSS